MSWPHRNGGKKQKSLAEARPSLAVDASVNDRRTATEE
jgi:hypothetical protein